MIFDVYRLLTLRIGFVVILVCLSGQFIYAEETEAAPNKTQRNLLEEAKGCLEKEQAQEALDYLAAWRGTEHSLQHLMTGHAYRILNKNREAAAAYRACLALDAQSRTAAMSLIDIYAAADQWLALKPLLQQWVQIDEDPLALLKVMIYCARELKDLRWAAAITQRALLRFPNDQDLRNIDIAVLIDAERWDEAQFAVKKALDSQPQDVRLWQYLSFIYQSIDKLDLALAASEAAVLIEPTNKDIRLHYAQAQLAAGHVQEAFAQMQLLVSQKTNDGQLLHIAAQSAYAAQQYVQAQQWLEQLNKLSTADKQKSITPQAQRNLAQLSLRILSDAKNYAKLDKKVDELLAMKLLNDKTILWLAQSAEQREQYARAELLYQVVRDSDSKDAAVANLYIARLWYSQGRKQHAQDVVRQHLKENPLDDYARRLLSLMQ